MIARNLIGGIAAVLIGLGYYALTLQLRATALDDSVGPAGFPRALAFSLIGLGLILCVQALWTAYTRPLAAGASAGARRAVLRGIARAAGMLALGIAYLAIVRRVGYLPSMALLMIAAALYLGAPFSWRVVAIGIAGAAVYWVVFVQILGIPQPPGLLAGLWG